MSEKAEDKGAAAGGHRIDNVHVEGGDFVIGNKNVVGRDGIIGDGNVASFSRTSAQGATVDSFLQLLAEIRSLLPEVSLDPELVQEAEGDLNAAEEQAKKAKPLMPLITAKLEGLAAMLAAAGAAVAAGQALQPALQRLAPLVQRALELAKQLF